jgi:hypothetical protein
MGRPIRFRLRSGKDDDIEEALLQAEKGIDRSDVIRCALRHYLLGEKIDIVKQPSTPIENLQENQKTDDDVEATVDDLFDDF